MSDATQTPNRSNDTLARQIRCAHQAAERAALAERYGRVWDTSELANDFEVLEFAAPFVIVRRKADKKLGSLMFQHYPRYYFSFEEDR